MFMDEIDKNGGVPNFKGAAIGDGCWGTAVGTCAFSTGKSHEINVEFFQGHGMYDQELYKGIKKSCGAFSDEDVQKKECKSLLDEMQSKIGKFDIYNIYDTCQAIGTFVCFFPPTSSLVPTVNATYADTPHAAAKRRMAKLEATGSTDLPTLAAVRNHVSLGGALNDFACGGGAWRVWRENRRELLTPITHATPHCALLLGVLSPPPPPPSLPINPWFRRGLRNVARTGRDCKGAPR